MEPENYAILEKGDSFWKPSHFQGRTASFRGCAKVRLGLRNAKMPSWKRVDEDPKIPRNIMLSKNDWLTGRDFAFPTCPFIMFK